MARELPMDFSQLGAASGGGLGFCWEKTAPSAFSVFRYARLPLSAQGMETYANIPGFIVALHALVASVFGICRKAKITPAIIRGIAVAMINFIWTPFAGHYQPREHMRSIVRSFSNLNDNMPFISDRSGDLSSMKSIPIFSRSRPVFPSEKSGIGIVSKKAQDKFLRQGRMGFLRHFCFLTVAVDSWPIMVAMLLQPLTQE